MTKRCVACFFFAADSQLTTHVGEHGTYYTHNAPCEGFLRPDKPKKPKCPECGHGKPTGHGGRRCIASVRHDYPLDGYEYDDCGCTFKAESIPA